MLSKLRQTQRSIYVVGFHLNEILEEAKLIYSDRKQQITGCLELGMWEIDCEGGMKELLKVIEMFHIFIIVMVTMQVQTFAKIH